MKNVGNKLNQWDGSSDHNYRSSHTREWSQLPVFFHHMEKKKMETKYLIKQYHKYSFNVNFREFGYMSERWAILLLT